MRVLKTLGTIALAAMSAAPALAQKAWLDPADILKPKPDSWPTYSGDYSGQRYSPLTEINKTNVHGLTLAWMQRLTGGSAAPQAVPGSFTFAPPAPPTSVGGVGTIEAPMGTVKGAILQVNGVLYVTSPDNVWALDA